MVRRRLVALVPSLLAASVLVFLLMHLVPGDPAFIIAGENASLEEIEAVRGELGLDDPLPVQYWKWMGDIVQGDLGTSLFSGEDVADGIWRTLPRTLHLMVGGLAVAVLVGVPLGMLAALRANRPTDTIVRTAVTAGFAIPNFWLGLLLVSTVALGLGWLPATGYVSVTSDLGDGLRHLMLPALTVGISTSAILARHTRSALLEVLHADYIRTLRAMGIRNRAIVWQHALKNASIPIVTIIGLQATALISGAFIIEVVFGIHGLGSYLIDAVGRRDFPVVQGTTMMFVVFVLLLNLVVDLLYLWLDPRVGDAA